MTAPLIVVQPPSAQPAAAPAGPVHFLSGGDAAALGLERLLLRAERLHRDRRLRRVAPLAGYRGQWCWTRPRTASTCSRPCSWSSCRHARPGRARHVWAGADRIATRRRP
jgi:hypothetical protein